MFIQAQDQLAKKDLIISQNDMQLSDKDKQISEMKETIKRLEALVKDFLSRTDAEKPQK